MSTPAASAERSALCITTPKAAAASATAKRISDGRMRLSKADYQRDAAKDLMVIKDDR